MNPLDFIGSPDWRSVVLALVFAAPWLILLAGKQLRRGWLWAVLLVGAVLFSVSIAWVQVPIQQAINALYAKTLPSATIQRYLLLLGVPQVAVAGLVQETVKFGIGVLGLYLIRDRRSPRAGLAMGAAAGAGYGIAEAFWVFNQIFATGITWATVQLSGVAALLGFIERFFTVMFHTSAASLAVYGFASGRPWRYLLLAIGLHTLTDYTVVLVQAKVVGLIGVEIIAGTISVATLVAALWVRFRQRSPLGVANG